MELVSHHSCGMLPLRSGAGLNGTLMVLGDCTDTEAGKVTHRRAATASGGKVENHGSVWHQLEHSHALTACLLVTPADNANHLQLCQATNARERNQHLTRELLAAEVHTHGLGTAPAKVWSSIFCCDSQ